jgi:hypothetical protein
MVEKLLKFIYPRKVILILDRDKAESLKAMIYSYGEHLAAGAEMKLDKKVVDDNGEIFILIRKILGETGRLV